MVKISNQSLEIAIVALVLAGGGQAQTAKSEQNSTSAPPSQSASAQPPAAAKPGVTGTTPKDPSAAAQPTAPKGTARADAGAAQAKSATGDPAANQSSAANQTETAATAAAEARKPLLSRSDSQVPGLGEGRLAGTISAAAKDTEEHTARALAGRTIRGSDGSRLGKIKDLLVDPRSGEVPYAVVSSGGMFARDRLFLVPFRALKSDGGHPKDFTVALNEDQWAELNPLGEQEFEADHLTITDSERRAIARRFGQAQSGEAASGSEFYTQNINSYLMRAEEMRGRDVYAGERSIGSIKDVVIDPTYGTAYALFDPSSRFSATKQDFVVPLNRYSFGATKQDRVTTMLERADFDRMRDIIEPSQAVGPNATAANKDVPRQGVAVQEKNNPAIANAKAAAAATGSFGGSTAAGTAGQTASAGTPASSQPAQSGKGNGQSAAAAANSAQQANASNRAPAAQGAAGNPPADAAKQKNEPATPVAKSGESNNGGQSAAVSASEKTGPAMASDAKSAGQPKSAAPKNETALEPTGRTNGEPNAPGGESLATAKAIRQMLDQESAEIARIEVTIGHDGGLVLKGAVADAQMKKSIEDKVTQVAKGAKFESQITVERK